MLKRVTLLVLLSILTVSYSLDAYSTLYTDKEVESDANIYHIAPKYYDPHVGRFISRDPLKDGLNWYTYARNNPLAFIDPTGLASRAPNETEMGHLRAAANFTFGRDNATWLMSTLRSVTLQDHPLSDLPGAETNEGHYDRALGIEIFVSDINKTWFDPASDMEHLARFIHELTHLWQDLTNTLKDKGNQPDPENTYSHTADQLLNLTFGHEPMAKAVQQWFYVMYGAKHNALGGDTAGHKYVPSGFFSWYAPGYVATTNQLVYIAGYYYHALINRIRGQRTATTWGAIKQ